MSAQDLEKNVETNASPVSPTVTEDAPQGILADSNIVDFDGPDDPENPLNWSPRYKWIMVVVLSLMNLMVNLGTIIVAPAAPSILSDFHMKTGIYSTILVSIWELGEIIGPLIIAPLSELYGRLAIYHVANVFFIIFSIGGAASVNINMLIAFRCLSGLTVASTTLNSGTVGDMFRQEERGKAMSIMGLCPLLGVVLGPIIGGYLTAAAGWRWTFWIITIMAGVIEIGFLFLRETYKVTILERKAKRLRKETGNAALRSKYQTDLSGTALFKKALIRPVKMLLFSPIVLILSLYGSVIYGMVYLLMTTITEVFEGNYHISEGPVGLVFLGIAIGMATGVFLCSATLDKMAKTKAAAAGGQMKPEYRLPPMLLGGITIPIGLFLYGWTADKHVQYVVPVIGTALMAFGMIVTTIPLSTYLVDSFTMHAASAIASFIVLRNITASVLPLAGPSLYGKLGLGWGNSVLGFIALGFVPITLLLMKYGERIRTNERFQVSF